MSEASETVMNKPPDKRKSTRAAREERISKVLELMTYGMKPQAIWQYASEKTDWNVSIRQIHRYILVATEQLKKSAQVDRETEIGVALERLDALYQRNLGIQDFKAALSVLKERVDLLGLAAPKHVKAEIEPSKSWLEFISSQAGQSGADQDEEESDDGDDGNAGDENDADAGESNE
jgi:hypothetical protein